MRNLINKDEALLVVTDWAERGMGMCLDETPELGIELTAFQALRFFDRNTVRVLRMDMESLKAEDITEDAAEAWLENEDANMSDLSAEDRLPVFVANSNAWAIHGRTIPAPRSKIYSTLDTRTQGIVHGARFAR